LLEQAVITTAEDFGKNIGGHECKTGLDPLWVRSAAQSFF
jgi:hypothetical protein